MLFLSSACNQPALPSNSQPALRWFARILQQPVSHSSFGSHIALKSLPASTPSVHSSPSEACESDLLRFAPLTFNKLTVIILSAAILTVTAIEAMDILEFNVPYPVLYASRIVRGTSSTLLLAILRDVHHIVKIYMLEIYDNDVQDNLVISINTRSEKCTLTYKGRCDKELVHKFHL